ncbi:MAG: hypothetical protein M3Y87_18175 [Myxococcota bacterium]|nr:hypothetical protein [Myxococcota bacterium]
MTDDAPIRRARDGGVRAPRVPCELDVSRLLGRWHIVATTLVFWRDKREWAFVDVAGDARWAVTWFSRATLGVTPEGMGVYARSAELPELDAILAALRARDDLPRLEGWYRTLRSDSSVVRDTRGRT